MKVYDIACICNGYGTGVRIASEKYFFVHAHSTSSRPSPQSRTTFHRPMGLLEANRLKVGGVGPGPWKIN